MVVSGANLEFCSTIVGWALPENHAGLTSRDFHYMRNTFSSRAFVQPQCPAVPPVIRHIYP